MMSRNYDLVKPRVLPGNLGVINDSVKSISGSNIGSSLIYNRGDIVHVIGIMYTEDYGGDLPISEITVISRNPDIICGHVLSSYIDPLTEYLGDAVESRLNVYGLGEVRISSDTFKNTKKD